MNNTYSDYANKTRSSKIILCHVEPTQRLSVFTLSSGTIYQKTVEHFVVGVKEDGTDLTEASSAALSTGEFFYDSSNSILYVNSTDDLEPKKHRIIATYRLFYSNRPIDLPYDLVSGGDVNYDGRLQSNSPINKELDSEQIGIVLESATSINLENKDSYFDDIYDVLIFENANVSLWLWSEILPLSEKKKIFSGIIQNKRFSESRVTFSCKDFLYRLRDSVSSENFTESDGNIPERYLYTPKRKIFGQHEQLRCVPIDSVLDGFDITGTVNGTAGTAIFTGSGTAFLDECSPEDEIFYNDGNQSYRFGIASVDSDTQLTLSDTLEITVSGSITNKPKIPWRKKNRDWHIAGHKLRSPSTTVAYAVTARRFDLTDATDFLDGDLIAINGTNVFISRVNGDSITLTAVLPTGIPTIGHTVTKNPLRKAFLDGREVFIDRDWSVINTSSDAILQLNELSEFNIAQPVSVPLTVDFTNGSRNIVINGADFTAQLSTRDWIRSDDVSHTTWYEVLGVVYDASTNDTTVTVRTSYSGATISTNAEKKNVSITDDQSIITVNCIGMESATGDWIKTASDGVKELLSTDASVSNINTTAFAEAKSDAPYILSIAIPDKIGGKLPTIRDIIDKINKSVFGSLTVDGNQDFKYETLTPKKPSDMVTLKDDDIIKINSISSRNEIVRKVNASYRFFADKQTGDDSKLLYEFESEFVDDMIGSTRELNIDLYLYNLNDATVIAQRYAFYNSMSQSTLTINGKLNLSLLELNEKVNLNLDRLYKRFGSRDRQKIGIINKITKTADGATVQINDLSNAFNRVASISANTAQDFTSAPNSEKIVNSYLVDNDTLTPDVNSDDELYQNSIG